MGFRTGRVVLGCREGFLDGIFLLYTLALLSLSTPMLPNTRAYCPKAGWRPQGFRWPGGLCRGVGFVRPVVRDSADERSLWGSHQLRTLKLSSRLFQNPGTVLLNSLVSVPLRLCVLQAGD